MKLRGRVYKRVNVVIQYNELLEMVKEAIDISEIFKEKLKKIVKEYEAEAKALEEKK